MDKLSARKRLGIVRLYFSGLSYDEIAARVGVGKGSVANVVAELKAGSIPEAADVGEQVELLRELSLDLKRSKMTPGQCAAGLILLNRISELGLDPADIDRWPMILRSVPNQEDAKEFVRLIYGIQEVQERSGLSLEALDNKVRELEKIAADLGPVADKVKECKKQLAELTRQREQLAGSVGILEQKEKLLTPRVNDLEKRDQVLSRRMADLEPEAKKAETTISALKGEMRRLEEIGFSLNELAGFQDKLRAIARRHAVEPSKLRSRLLRELEALEKGLSLETLIQSRQQDLDKAQKALVVTKNEIETARAVVDSLTQEKTKLEASIKETREKVSQEIVRIVPLAEDAIGRLQKDLQRGNDEALVEMARLREEAIEVGREVGRYQGILEVSEWLTELLALVKGEEGIEGKRVRILTLLVLRALHSWLKRQDYMSFKLLPHSVKGLITELEQWKA